MSKKATLPVSLRDSAYRFALQNESLETIVRFVLESNPTFADEVSKETRSELFAGFQLRKHELTGDKGYRIGDGGTYIPVDENPDIVLNINYAMAYTPVEFGKMRESDPAKHAVIRVLRDSFSTYASNKLRDMQRIAKRLTQGDAPRTRAVNKDFRTAVKSGFESLEKRVRNAEQRGDPDANAVRFRTAVAAFWKSYDE